MQILHPACPALTALAAPQCPMTGQTQVFGEGARGGGTGVCRGKDDTTGFQNDAARNDSDAGEGEQVAAGNWAGGPRGRGGAGRGVPGPSLQTARWGAGREPQGCGRGPGGAAHPRPGLERDDRCQLTCFFLSKLLISESFYCFKVFIEFVTMVLLFHVLAF